MYIVYCTILEQKYLCSTCTHVHVHVHVYIPFLWSRKNVHVYVYIHVHDELEMSSIRDIPSHIHHIGLHVYAYTCVHVSFFR